MPGEVLAAPDIGEAKHADGKTVAVGSALAADAHKFEAAAAEVADDARRIGNGAENAACARKAFVGAAQYLDFPPACPLQVARKIRPVARIPDRRGCIGLEPFHLEQGGDIDESLERLLGEPAPLRVQPAGAVEVGAELAGRLVVEQRAETVRPVAVNDQPHRIGADIDNADPSGGPRLLGHAVRLMP